LPTIDVHEYESLARDSGVYKDIEIEILAETLLAWKSRPGEPHILLDLRDGKFLAGFAILAKAQNTDSAYDIRDFCIDRAYIGKGVGERLIEMLEEETKRLETSALIRLEISRRKEDSLGRGLFLSCGYTLVGHIPDFYGTEDDYFMYLKYIAKAPGQKADGGGSGTAAPGGDGSGAAAPDRNGSGAAAPDSDGSGAAAPGSDGPGAAHPNRNGPEAAAPGSDGPGAAAPGGNGSGAAAPDRNGPEAARPGSDSPGAAAPGGGPGAAAPDRNGPEAAAKPSP